ncbi:MAG: pantoate--beta-alanine ligase [Phycisphaerae bacterium]|nr:pantoate--beta-alanine ligase [Phycisphaerae bacterium]
MLVVQTIAEVRKFVGEARESRKSVGFVPTMGALHEGHASLIRRAVERCDYVVLSVFVNPTQFGPSEDLAKYPRTFDADRQLADRLGVDLCFAPSASEMYAANCSTYVVPEGLQDALCGRSRPGHFRGVCTVVAKLFNIVRPDVAFFGQKDAQQAVIVQRMIEDLNFAVELEVLPTVREPDGLAMSSRNAYLSPAQRQDALCLFHALQAAFAAITRAQRDAAAIRAQMQQAIAAMPSARVEYIELVDAATLKPVTGLAGHHVLIALAVHVGATRLIDNIVVDVT